MIILNISGAFSVDFSHVLSTLRDFFTMECCAIPFLFFQGELLAELLERVFAALSRVLRNHLNAMQLIQQKLTDRHVAASASASPSSSSSSSSPSLPSSSALAVVAPPLLNYRADVVWRAIQEEVQDMLSDYIQVNSQLASNQMNRTCKDVAYFAIFSYCSYEL
jgi:hypothetical protein